MVSSFSNPGFPPVHTRQAAASRFSSLEDCVASLEVIIASLPSFIANVIDAAFDKTFDKALAKAFDASFETFPTRSPICAAKAQLQLIPFPVQAPPLLSSSPLLRALATSAVKLHLKDSAAATISLPASKTVIHASTMIIAQWLILTHSFLDTTKTGSEIKQMVKEVSYEEKANVSYVEIKIIESQGLDEKSSLVDIVMFRLAKSVVGINQTTRSVGLDDIELDAQGVLSEDPSSRVPIEESLVKVPSNLGYDAGLFFLGNTYYMNSTIQFLHSVPELKSALINELDKGIHVMAPVQFWMVLLNKYPHFGSNESPNFVKALFDIELVSMVHCIESGENVSKSLQSFEGHISHETIPVQWVVSVQLHQHASPKPAIFYLEQLILKHSAAASAIESKTLMIESLQRGQLRLRSIMKSSAKEIAFDQHFQHALQGGIDKLLGVIGLTFGFKGRNFVLDDCGSPKVMSEGVKFGRAIELPHDIGTVGEAQIREVFSKTNDFKGDKTTNTLKRESECTRGKKSLSVKGAVENLLEKSTKVQLVDGTAVPLDDSSRNYIMQALHELSTSALKPLNNAPILKLVDIGIAMSISGIEIISIKRECATAFKQVLTSKFFSLVDKANFQGGSIVMNTK
ncbi:chaperonin 60 subunit alpha 1 [Pyrus ussuriensis x Pyrus communis]|uniref:Chaperonin 60 subunit alpha 1 n=1 Tax=Pyrus ussuriensis x Pyrus communis TaxID=2448454 RepID=A0A5N5EX67_9ROSA|nr:chaperonin 60 subunit alpha 1 [Pyrus ussuriensis x Pyrus communis]